MRKAMVLITLFWTAWFGAAAWYIYSWYGDSTMPEATADTARP